MWVSIFLPPLRRAGCRRRGRRRRRRRPGRRRERAAAGQRPPLPAFRPGRRSSSRRVRAALPSCRPSRPRAAARASHPGRGGRRVRARAPPPPRALRHPAPGRVAAARAGEARAGRSGYGRLPAAFVCRPQFKPPSPGLPALGRRAGGTPRPWRAALPPPRPGGSGSRPRAAGRGELTGLSGPAPQESAGRAAPSASSAPAPPRSGTRPRRRNWRSRFPGNRALPSAADA